MASPMAVLPSACSDPRASWTAWRSVVGGAMSWAVVEKLISPTR